MDERRIRVGVGGWTYAPWRDNFYPRGLPQHRELHHASRALTAIEVNGTFYSTFTPATFAKWHDETPPGFVFALKAHRFATHRRALASAGEAIDRFIGSGLAALGDKLGPIVWQLMPTARFNAADLDAFLRLLPRELNQRPPSHVIDPRHASFACQEYLDLIRRHGCTTVYSDAEQNPCIPNDHGELAYLRLMRSEADCATGYPPAQLAAWAAGAQRWAARSDTHRAFVFFINGAKERAPAAATALLRQLGS